MNSSKESEMHQHSWKRDGDMESCGCGAARVVVDAETQARRDRATIAFKQRYNATLKSR